VCWGRGEPGLVFQLVRVAVLALAHAQHLEDLVHYLQQHCYGFRVVILVECRASFLGFISITLRARVPAVA
jgi:hypothetical protein